jgi:hypothetical protein
MNQIMAFIVSNWVEWLFLIVTGIIGWGYKVLMKKQKAEEIKNMAIREGLQALLRDRIINAYNRSQEKGYCPIYEKESLRRLYGAYHNLGGNDVATGLYEKVMDMDSERKD